ncbi:Glucose transporter type 1 [Eumeta japonica]|uniref:Glucose transporter type 1 n=1 Tax=Eumeta variegata TaxID=151549 RepID=A0A4C1SIX8_EUMVA|nr:Glucose transporter type 1 [Eumeta japonica]
MPAKREVRPQYKADTRYHQNEKDTELNKHIEHNTAGNSIRPDPPPMIVPPHHDLQITSEDIHQYLSKGQQDKGNVLNNTKTYPFQPSNALEFQYKNNFANNNTASNTLSSVEGTESHKLLATEEVAYTPTTLTPLSPASPANSSNYSASINPASSSYMHFTT